MPKKDWWQRRRVTWTIETIVYPEIQGRWWFMNWDRQTERGFSIGLFFVWVTRTERKKCTSKD